MNPICYLCGQEIVNKAPSGDHTVPQQFIKRSQPKTKGFDYGGKILTHAKCNNQFGPEKMCSKALQLLGAYSNQYVNLKNPKIKIQVFTKNELDSFSKEDIKFFGLIDTTNVPYEDWAHNTDFFKDKKKTILLEKPLNIALSVLTKSAAALLVKRFNVSPKSYWNVLCIPYQAPSFVNLDSIFGNTKPFDIGIKIWIRKYEKSEDFVVWYENKKILLIIVFSFSQDEKCRKDCVKVFHEAEKLSFKSPKLMDLVNYNWLKNALPI